MTPAARASTSPLARRVRNAAVLGVLLTALWSTSGALDSEDTQVRLRVAEQLISEGRLVVATYGGAGQGSQFRDAAGLYTSQYGIGQSLFFLPFVAVIRPLVGALQPSDAFRLRATRFLVSVSVFAFVLLAVFVLGVLNARALGAGLPVAYFAAFMAVFGSSFWQMAKQGQEENQIAIATLLALYGCLRWTRTRRGSYVWLSAASAGAALLVRPTAFTLFIGIAGLYALELWRGRRKALPVIAAFAIAGIGALAVIFAYNAFKAGHPIRFGYGTHQGRFATSTWWHGVWGSIFALDRGIVWQNLWLLPAALVVAYNWRRLRHELRSAVGLAAFLFLASVALYAAWPGWAGGIHTYGTRFQQHLVPLLALTLSLAALEALRGSLPWIARWAAPAALAAAALQLPSISLVHNLEAIQAIISGAWAPPGKMSTVSMGGQLRLRHVNIATKLATGLPVQVPVMQSKQHLRSLLADSSRWDYWPWRLDKYLGPSPTRAARVLWLALLASSVAAWIVAFRHAGREADAG